MKIRSPFAVLVPLLMLAGCASNPWSRAFEPAAPARPALAADAPVTVREVPWSRMDRTLRDATERLAASDAPLEEWPVSERESLKADLLRGLQVTAAPERVEVLGRSVLRTTAFARPDDRQLAEAARAVGATDAVWAGHYVGKADTVRSEPVYATGATFGYGWGSGWGHGWRGPYGAYSPGVAYVPVVVRADEYAFVAFFLAVPVE